MNVENCHIFMQTVTFWTENINGLILFIRLQAVLQAVLFKV